MPSSTPASNDGVRCWIAIGDVEVRRQSVAPRRATPTYFHLPFDEEVPREIIDDLVADICEGLDEVFDRPNCPAPFIPGYLNKDDAIARVKLLRSLGRECSHIILVRLTCCEPKIKYRRLEVYAERLRYRFKGLTVPAEQVLIICESLTTQNIVEELQVLV
jgi:hypothetical protein